MQGSRLKSLKVHLKSSYFVCMRQNVVVVANVDLKVVDVDLNVVDAPGRMFMHVAV